MECCDEDVVACFYEGVLACFDNNNKDYFDVDLLHTKPLEYPLEETLVGKCLVQHYYMQKIGWCETYYHFCYHHNYKNQMIYYDHLNDGKEKRWYKT